MSNILPNTLKKLQSKLTRLKTRKRFRIPPADTFWLDIAQPWFKLGAKFGQSGKTKIDERGEMFVDKMLSLGTNKPGGVFDIWDGVYKSVLRVSFDNVLRLGNDDGFVDVHYKDTQVKVGAEFIVNASQPTTLKGKLTVTDPENADATIFVAEGAGFLNEVRCEYPLSLKERSTDPADPYEGKMTIWMSDGTGSGDDGDIMVKITAGGTTKITTLIDFSAI